MDQRLFRINATVSMLNVIFPAFYAWCYTIEIATKQTKVLSLYYTSTSLNLLLQITSLWFLSSALWQIKHQVKNRSVLTINENAMLLHYLCFCFFLLATVVFYITDLIDPPP